MKDIIKYIIVIFSFPAYIAIQILKAVEIIAEPLADAMRTWIDDMYEFWFKD